MTKWRDESRSFTKRRFWKIKYLTGMDFLTASLLQNREGCHMHHGFTISIVEKGILPLNFKNMQMTLKPGEFLLLGPEVPHGFCYPLAQGDCAYRTVFLKESIMPKALASQLSNEKSTISKFSDHDLWEHFQNVQDGVESGSVTDIDSIVKMTEFILGKMPQNKICSFLIRSSHIRTIKKYLQENFTSVPNILYLSEIADISPFYLMRLFKEEIGLSPHAYINQLRVNMAREMIDQKIPFLKITYDLGFSDQSHFSKTFLKITGVNPVQYAKSNA
ncbi:MAG: AraC family transcriptional regulator [Synergistales bacterium]|jgi:AraC-like DNA-binding protein